MSNLSLRNHLEDRHLDTNLHTAWIDEEQETVTFPCWNLSGQIVGTHKYRPNGSKDKNNDPREGKYFTRCVKPSVHVWGMESWYLSNTLFVQEGIFDASHLTWYGASAIATLSNDLDKNTASWLRTVRAFRPVVVVCDGDKAGIKLAKYGHEAVIMDDGYDLGDATEDFVKTLIERYA